MVPGTAHWQRTIFPTGALPHLEQPHEFCRIFDGFLQDDPLRRVRAQRAVAASQIEVATSLP
jgi:hypothetical protein